jgi:DNA mismatch endonuclease (patch repair protein)
MDKLTKERRSWNMSRILSKNTKPELIVRSLLHGMGYRFRLHVKKLPGNPDIVLPKYRTIIFVHGCFWHQHPECKFAYTPKSRQEFWGEKLKRNVMQHERIAKDLDELGWQVIVVWECEIANVPALKERLVSSLNESICVG